MSFVVVTDAVCGGGGTEKVQQVTFIVFTELAAVTTMLVTSMLVKVGCVKTGDDGDGRWISGNVVGGKMSVCWSEGGLRACGG